MILMDPQQKEITTVLGEGETEYVINNAILMQILINPGSDSTTYDFSITDVLGNVTQEETNCQGLFNQLMSVPIYGNLTLAISNSSVDATYTCVLTFRRS